MRGAAAETIEQTVCNEGCDLRGFDVLKCTGICTNHCDRRHGAAFSNERHSSCQHGSGARKKALFEPGDTRRQWKGEAAACFVHTGITSSRMLPTSSIGYWFPSLTCGNASASEATRSFGGVFSSAALPASVLNLKYATKKLAVFLSTPSRGADLRAKMNLAWSADTAPCPVLSPFFGEWAGNLNP